MQIKKQHNTHLGIFKAGVTFADHIVTLNINNSNNNSSLRLLLAHHTGDKYATDPSTKEASPGYFYLHTG